jgi:benzoylformate decarboxylase
MFGEQSMPVTSQGDVNLVVGTYMMPEVFPLLGPIFAAGAKVVHIDLNAYEIAKNHPVDIGVVADPKLTLAALFEALQKSMNADQKNAARKEPGRSALEKTANRRLRWSPIRRTRTDNRS